MIPFKRILCPLDFSKPSIKALESAGEIAREFSSELVVIHVIESIPLVTPTPDGISFDVYNYQKEMESYAKKRIKKEIEKFVPPDLEVKWEIIHGNPAGEVVEYAKNEGVDLIVISLHGASGWERFLAGSVAKRIVNLSPCPVLSMKIPEDEE